MSEGTPHRRTLMVNAASPSYAQGTAVPAPAASPVLPSTSPAAVTERERPPRDRYVTETYDARGYGQQQQSQQHPSSEHIRAAQQYPTGEGAERNVATTPPPTTNALQEKDKIILELLQLVKLKDSELSNLTEELSLLRREMQELSAEVKLYRRGFQPEVAAASPSPAVTATGNGYSSHEIREGESRVAAATHSPVGGVSVHPHTIGVVGSYNPSLPHQGVAGSGSGVVISGGSAFAFHHHADAPYPNPHTHQQENQSGQTPFATPPQLSALHVDFDASRATVEPLGDGQTPPRGQPVVVYQPYQNGYLQPTSAARVHGNRSAVNSGLHPRPTPITPTREEVMRMVDDHERQVQRVLDGVENAKLRVAHRQARGKERDDYLLDAGSFRVRDSKTPIIAQAVGQRRLTPDAIKAADLSNLTPRRQVELYGAVTRAATPGPATYSPLWNRLATPKRTASPKRK